MYQLWGIFHYQEMGDVTLEAVRRLREEAGATIRVNLQ